MKKVILETKVKLVDDEVVRVLDETKLVEEVSKAYEVKQFHIAANNSITIDITGGEGVRGAKGIKITSDVRLKLSHTHMASNYNVGFYVKEITLFGGQDTGFDDGSTSVYTDGDTIGYLGNIVLTNSEEQPANVKVIWYY